MPILLSTRAEATLRGRVLAHCLQATAAILHAMGDNEAALDLAEHSVKLAHDASHRVVETPALLGLARIHRALDRPRQAQAWACQALSLAETCGYLELAHEADLVSCACEQ